MPVRTTRETTKHGLRTGRTTPERGRGDAARATAILPPGRRVFATAALPLLLAACDLLSPDPRPTRMAVAGLGAPLLVGEAASLSATVLDQEGRPLAGEPVTWTSRDPTTATVDSAGTVTGVLSGEAWIVAESGRAADSLRADVRFDPGPGQAFVRVSGDTALVAAGYGASAFQDYLGRDDGDHHDVLAGGRADGGRVPLSFAVFAPGLLPEGVTDLPSWPVGLLNQPADALPGPIAAVALVEDPVGGGVDEVLVTRPPARVEARYDAGAGEVRLRLVADAEGFDVGLVGGRALFTPNGRRYRVVADARLSHHHALLGSSDGTLEVDGVARPWVRGGARWGGDVPAGDFALRVEARLERDLRLELAWPPGPDGATTGTWDLTPGAGPGGASASLRWAGGGSELLAAPASGALEVRRFVLRGRGEPGEIAGRVEGAFVAIGGAADTLRVAVDFVAPVGAPTAASAGPPPSLLQHVSTSVGGRRR